MPIKIFYGSDRMAARRAAERILGAEYEVIEAEDLSVSDLESIFKGTTIFDMGSERKILLKDLSSNIECFEKLPEYANTSALVALLEGKLSKVSAGVKAVFACKEIEAKEFTLREELSRDKFENFAPFQAAYAGRGADALRKLKIIKGRSAPQAMIGTMGALVVKNINTAKGQRAIKIIAKADLMTKSSSVADMWLPVEWALLEIAQLK